MQTITGTLTDDGVSQLVFIEPGETIAAVLAVADTEAFEGVVSVEVSRDGINFTPAISAAGSAVIFTGTDDVELEGAIFNGVLTNTDSKRVAFRVRVYGVEQDGIEYSLTERLGDRTGVLLRDAGGTPVLWSRDDGGIEAAGLVAGSINPAAVVATVEALVSNETTATAVSLDVYKTEITTSGSEGAEDVTIGDGTGAVIGQRKLIEVAALGHATDEVTLDHANMADADGGLTEATLEAAGSFVLVEWNGIAWQVIYSAGATLTPE